MNITNTNDRRCFCFDSFEQLSEELQTLLSKANRADDIKVNNRRQPKLESLMFNCIDMKDIAFDYEYEMKELITKRIK